MDCYASSDCEGLACGGVRGIQTMRRSRSLSSIGRKARPKVVSASEYFNVNGLPGAHAAAPKVLKGEPMYFGMEWKHASTRKKGPTKAIGKKPVVNELATEPPVAGSENSVSLAGASETTKLLWDMFYHGRFQSYEEFNSLVGDVDVSMTESDAIERSGVSIMHPARYFFSNPIHFYEEFYNFVGEELQKLDDEAIDTLSSQALVRRFFCADICSYEEFYALAGDGGLFDDEIVQPVPVPHCVRTFFCNPISSYEEYYNLAGPDAELDEAIHNAEDSMSVSLRSLFCKPIESYEEFYNLTAGEGNFDDEQVITVDTSLSPWTFFCKPLHSFQELYDLAGDSLDLLEAGQCF